MKNEELQLSLKDRLLISPAGQWASEHRNLLINIGLAVLVLAIWGGGKALRSSNANAVCAVHEAYEAWKAKPDDSELLQRFEKSLASAPEIKRILNGEIAQILLTTGRVDAAEQTASESLRELRAIAPDYAEFSAISLLIAKKQLQEALEKSVSLKEKLNEKSFLYQHNLIRIALLHQQLKNYPGEWSAWRDLEQSGLMDLDDALGFVVKGSKDLSVRFTSYVHERKTFLEPLLTQ